MDQDIKPETLNRYTSISVLELLGLSLMGPAWLALSTSEGKAKGLEPWPLNQPIVWVDLKGFGPGFNSWGHPLYCNKETIGGLRDHSAFLLGLSLMGPPWLALSTFKGKAKGPEPWPLNQPIVWVDLKGFGPRFNSWGRFLYWNK